MSVVRVDILCECDGCQKRFGIEADIGRDLDWPDFEALAREELLNGREGYTWGVRGKSTVERFPLTGWPTVQADLMLCDECTRKCDDLPIDRDLTRAEVNQALGLPGETS